MALFSRRVLQRLILENAAFVDLQQRRRQAAAINRGGRPSLSIEWEIAVLNAMSKFYLVRHEQQFGGRYPDLAAYKSAATVEPSFVADITTVFEKGREERNPVSALSKELIRRATRLGIDANKLRLDVNGDWTGSPDNRVMDLHLPALSAITAFFDENLTGFLVACAGAPDQRHEFKTTEGASLTITYDPANRYFGTSHPSYTANYSITRNPLHNVIKRKLDQLRGVATRFPTGVIVCSADVNLHSSSSAGFSPNRIVDNLFRQHSSLSFVLMLWATDRWSVQRGEIHQNLRLNPQPQFPLSDESVNRLSRLSEAFPEPRNGGVNALNELDFWRWKNGRYFYGGWQVSENRIQCSARTLMEYLAGRISQEEFSALHGTDRGFVQFFESKLRQGKLLVGAEIQHVDTEDDDWVVFHFGPSDPAISPIRPDPDPINRPA